MTLFKNKYRVESTRLRNWDYSSDGRYFITICTKDRELFLGKIKNGEMFLNAHGKIVEQCWFDLVNHYHNLQLGAFVIMPNHIHGIMIIDNSREISDPDHLNSISGGDGQGVMGGGNRERNDGGNYGVDGIDGIVETGLKPVSTNLPTIPPTTLPTIPPTTLPTIPPTTPPTTLPTIPSPSPQLNPRHGICEFVRALKTFSSRRMNEMDHTVGKTRWQSRFHDHIIRDEQEFERIQQYIYNNPGAWGNDSLNP